MIQEAGFSGMLGSIEVEGVLMVRNCCIFLKHDSSLFDVDPRLIFLFGNKFYNQSSIDVRQVSRWKACADEHSGRWLRAYLGKLHKAGLKKLPEAEDETVSPVIRQVLQVWCPIILLLYCIPFNFAS